MADIPDISVNTQTQSGDSAFENVFVYGKLNYDFDNTDLKVKSIQASESSTFKSDIIVEGNLTSTSGLNLSGDITIGGASGHVGLATFKDARFYGKIFDGDGDFGTSGQLLSSDGTDLNWIDASTTSVANANNVGVNVNSTNADQYITFVGSTSGNRPIRVDSDLKYNPSTNTIATIKINDLQVVGELKDGDGDFGTSGQVLSSDGTDTAWINAGSLTAGAAAEVGVTAVNNSSTHYLTFVDSSSGNANIKVDTNLTYNPSTDTLSAINIAGSSTAVNLNVTNDLTVGGKLKDGDGNFGTAGQVLRSDGTNTEWVNTGTLAAGAAAEVGVTAVNDNASHFLTFVDSSSGNENIKVDTNFTYNPFTNTLNVPNISGNGSGLSGIEAFVTGMIILWYGNTGNIPTGFVLCDGNNSTPDLRDRFVVGAGSAYSPGDTGGSSSVTLSTSNLPSHTHGAGSYSASNVSLTGDITKISECYNVAGGATGVFTKKGTGNSPVTGSSSNSPTAGVDFDASHSHSVSGTSGSTGSGSSIENRPPYYALCYIMKT